MEIVKCFRCVSWVANSSFSGGQLLGFHVQKSSGSEKVLTQQCRWERVQWNHCEREVWKERALHSHSSQFGRRSVSQQCWADKSCLPAFNLLKIRKLFHSYNAMSVWKYLWTLGDAKFRSRLRFHGVWKARLYQGENCTDGLRGVMFTVYLETMDWLSFSCSELWDN